jgi:hypothetical protein
MTLFPTGVGRCNCPGGVPFPEPEDKIPPPPIVPTLSQIASAPIQPWMVQPICLPPQGPPPGIGVGSVRTNVPAPRGMPGPSAQAHPRPVRPHPTPVPAHGGISAPRWGVDLYGAVGQTATPTTTTSTPTTATTAPATVDTGTLIVGVLALAAGLGGIAWLANERTTGKRSR